MDNKLCQDNALCCDDNCKRCANLVYDRYMELKKEMEVVSNSYKLKERRMTNGEIN